VAVHRYHPIHPVLAQDAERLPAVDRPDAGGAAMACGPPKRRPSHAADKVGEGQTTLSLREDKADAEGLHQVSAGPPKGTDAGPHRGEGAERKPWRRPCAQVLWVLVLRGDSPPVGPHVDAERGPQREVDP
jgi:hypothetical protein